jgi:hypothetical protein
VVVRLIAALLMLAVTACGARSRRTLETSDAGPPPAGQPRDPAKLAEQRCSAFELPAREISLLAPGAGFPMYGRCGHLYRSTSGTTPIYSPDLTEIVAESRNTPIFSADGSRVAVRPPAPEDNVVRRLDLVTRQVFDTEVVPTELYSDALKYGLFLDSQGEVMSYVCDSGRLRVFADRSTPQAALFEVEVPSCAPTLSLESNLLWSEPARLFGVDLPGLRSYDYAIDDEIWRSPDYLEGALDGYAVGAVVRREQIVGDVFSRFDVRGALLDTRTGQILAHEWERVPMADGRYAVNRLGSSPALLVDDGASVVAYPGLRARYVFRDQARAFALRTTPAGPELVLAELTSGEMTPLAGVSSLVWEAAPDSYAQWQRVSPRETAAYFVLNPYSEDTDDPEDLVLVRWLEGSGEVLTLPGSARPVSAPRVADNGTALIDSSRGGYVLRHGADAEYFEVSPGGILDALGTVSATVRPKQSSPTYLFSLVAVSLSDGEERTVITDMASFTGYVSDAQHRRLAIAIAPEGEDVTINAELWAGRFPALSAPP